MLLHAIRSQKINQKKNIEKTMVSNVLVSTLYVLKFKTTMRQASEDLKKIVKRIMSSVESSSLE